MRKIRLLGFFAVLLFASDFNSEVLASGGGDVLFRCLMGYDFYKRFNGNLVTKQVPTEIADVFLQRYSSLPENWREYISDPINLNTLSKAVANLLADKKFLTLTTFNGGGGSWFESSPARLKFGDYSRAVTGIAALLVLTAGKSISPLSNPEVNRCLPAIEHFAQSVHEDMWGDNVASKYAFAEKFASATGKTLEQTLGDAKVLLKQEDIENKLKNVENEINKVENEINKLEVDLKSKREEIYKIQDEIVKNIAISGYEAIIYKKMAELNNQKAELNKQKNDLQLALKEIKEKIKKYEEYEKIMSDAKKQADYITAVLRTKGFERFAAQILADVNIKTGEQAVIKAQELEKAAQEAKKRADEITAALKTKGLERLASQILTDANIKTGEQAVSRARELAAIDQSVRREWELDIARIKAEESWEKSVSPTEDAVNQVVSENNLSRLKILASKGAAVTKVDINYPISWGYLDIVKYLVEKGLEKNIDMLKKADVNEAIRHKRFETLKYLVDKGVDLKNVSSDAIRNTSPEIREYLKSKGVTVDR
jgi:hypothetical protein